jgi:phospholipid/cholesterol/gamma-HCH transport system permease protein
LPLLVFVGDRRGDRRRHPVSAWQLGIPPETFTSRFTRCWPRARSSSAWRRRRCSRLFIALIACRMGMSVDRDARSVGEHTTSTVVQSIVWVIVLDAAFAVIAPGHGI